MGGLKAKVPRTYWMMIAGTLAITGVGIPFSYDLVGLPIGFAGFVSKDIIIESVFAGHNAAHLYAYTLLVLAAAMTSFYSWRLIFLTFHGTTRADKHTYEHAHESPPVMMWPLYVLAGGAVLAGMIWYTQFVGKAEQGWWDAAIVNLQLFEHDGEMETVLQLAHHVPWWVKLSPFVAMLLGLGLAWYMYLVSPETPKRLAARHEPLYRFLLNKWYFDELYDAIFVRPAMWLGRTLWRRGDGGMIDGALNGIAMGIVPWLTRFAGRVQSGFLFHYAFVMLIGVAALITWFAFRGGA